MAKSYNDLQRKALISETASTGSPTETVNDLASPELLAFEREILNHHGVTISVSQDGNTEFKFGVNGAASTSEETVWSTGGHEVYVTTNAIDQITSSSAADVTEVTVTGHTVVDTGASAVYTAVVQNVTLTGQTIAALTTPLARVSRVQNATATDLVGTIYVTETDTVTAGVPDTAAKIHAEIVAGNQNSEKCADTISGDEYLLITEVGFFISKGSSASTCDFVIETRDPGKAWLHRYIATVSNTNAAYTASLGPGIIVHKNSDVRVVCTATAAIPVSAFFSGYFAVVI